MISTERYVCTVCNLVVIGFGGTADPALCNHGKPHRLTLEEVWLENEQLAQDNEKLSKQNSILVKQKFDNLYSKDIKQVKIFQEKGSVKTPPFPQEIQRIPYWRRCLVCSREHKPGGLAHELITRAHIVVNSNKSHLKDTYQYFGLAGGFKTKFDGFSVRNHLPLCGTEGVEGSCHAAFDAYEMSIVYNPLSRRLRCYWPENRKHHNREIRPPEGNMPYRRILNFRARYQAIISHDEELLDLTELCAGANASEEGDRPAKKQKTHSLASSSTGGGTSSWEHAARTRLAEADAEAASKLAEEWKISPNAALLLVLESKRGSAAFDFSRGTLKSSTSKEFSMLAKAKHMQHIHHHRETYDGMPHKNWDWRFLPSEGWERHQVGDGGEMYFNKYTCHRWFKLRGG